MTNPDKPGRYLATLKFPRHESAQERTEVCAWNGKVWSSDHFPVEVTDWCELPTVAEVRALRGTP